MKVIVTQNAFIQDEGVRKDIRKDGTLYKSTIWPVKKTIVLPTSRSYGDNYPDWRQRLREHKGAVTDLSVSEQSISILGSTDCWAESPYLRSLPDNRWCKSTLSGVFAQAGAPELPYEREMHEASNVAKTNYLKSINGQLRSIQSLVTLGEISESVRLILRPGRSIVALTERFRRDYIKSRTVRGMGGDHRRNSALPRTFADLWLTYSFGVIPLLADIDDAMKGLSRVMNPEDVPLFYRVGGSRQTSRQNNTTVKGFNHVPFMWDIITETLYEVGVKYYGELDMKMSTVHNTSRQLGLDFVSVIPAAWELIPYSFLVDYFTNIGEVFESLAVPQGGVRWNAFGYSVTKDVTTKVVNMRITPSHLYPGQEWFFHGNTTGSTVRSRGRIIKRVPNPGYVLPTFETPSISGFVQKWKQQANTLALAVLKLRKV